MSFEAIAFPKSEIEYRVLSPAASQHFAERVTALGYKIPHPNLATFIVAVEGDDVVGFLAVQLIFHIEPLYVDPAHRGKGITERLGEEAKSFMSSINVKACLALPQNEFSENLCKKFGMTEVRGKIYAHELS